MTTLTQLTTVSRTRMDAVLAPIFDAHDENHAALLVVGRSMDDLAVDGPRLRTLKEGLRDRLRERYGMVLIECSLADGLDWDEPRMRDDRDRSTVRRVLDTHGLLEITQDEHQIARLLRGVSSLTRAPAHGLQWTDGTPLRFGVLLSFAEHLLPGSLTNGPQTDAQSTAVELAYNTSRSLALRASGNLVMFHGREGLLDPLVAGTLQRIALAQPDADEKREFVEACAAIYPDARFDDELTPAAAGHLAARTPNRGTEALMRGSQRTGRPVTARDLSVQKSRDVEALSEGKLVALDDRPAEDTELYGRNMVAPRIIMESYGAGLARGNTAIPGNVLLVGPPGSGKTALARMTARRAKAAAYEMLSPKAGIVGETERLARLQQVLLREWVPNVAFVDEVTEVLPMERGGFDGDSGASRAVTGALLSALSDEGRRGRSLLVGTTNRPWAMSSAMTSRWVFVPVLHPLEEDYPGIIAAIASRSGAALDQNDPSLADAAALFYSKGANPRHIVAALNDAILLQGALTPKTVLSAADDLLATADRVSTVFADLCAIRLCSRRSLLPWHNASDYPFPPHLRDLVDPATGEVDSDALDRRIEELRPHANV